MSTLASPSLGSRQSSFSSIPAGIANTAKQSSKFGVLILAIYLYLITGRALDVSPLWVLHIPMIMLILLTVMTFAAGDFKRAFSSTITKYFAAFTVWVVVCFPFSAWRAGSLPSVQWQLQSFAIFFIIVQTVRSRQDWEKIAGAYAYATLTGALLSFYLGVSVQGRVALPGGTLGDPNEFALVLVVGLPFWWFKASRTSGLRKVAYLLATVPMYAAFARAGSRSGMIALVVLFAIAFLLAQGNKKVMIGLGAVIAVMAASFLLPDYLKARYMTFFDRDGSSNDVWTNRRLGADIASSENRKALLIQSLEMTFKHPIVGVGPGDFSFVSWDERKATTGVGGENLVSHNTYTQISSETGIPGFFLFAGTVFLSLKYAFVDYRRKLASNSELTLCSRYLLYTSGALFAGIFFLSVGYTHMLAILFALATSIRLISEQSVATVPVTAAATANPGKALTPGPTPQRQVRHWDAPSRLRPRRPRSTRDLAKANIRQKAFD